uniref:CCHC-type domain-containing protein n=1 Tax=Arundo donax TaxID=35708 RepID=A0A0A9E6H4_ARUDO
MVLPQPTYNIVVSMIYDKEIDKMIVTKVVGKIRAHKLFLQIDKCEDSSEKSLAFKVNSKEKEKKNKKKMSSFLPSSDSDDKDEEEKCDEDDAELALLMRKTTKVISRLGKKCFNYDSKNNKFGCTKSDGSSKKMCYNCGSYNHLSYDCPKPDKRENKNKDGGKHEKKSHNKKKNKKLFIKDSKGRKAYVVGEWISDESGSDSSDDEKNCYS